MAAVADHSDAVAVELEPQLWSTRQPWFAERLAALRTRIGSGPREVEEARQQPHPGNGTNPRCNKEVAHEPASS